MPSKHSLVCSCHFKDKNRKNLPTIFTFNMTKTLTFPSPEKRKITEILKPEQSVVSDPITHSSSSALPDLDIELQQQDQVATSGHQLPQASTSRYSSGFSGASREAENYFLKEEIKSLTERLKNLTTRFSHEHIKGSDKQILMYTGIPTNELFMVIFDLMK
ncbi:hypothetical protein YQE_02666, partial [Dendroctonus ponderosae]